MLLPLTNQTVLILSSLFTIVIISSFLLFATEQLIQLFKRVRNG